MKDLKISKLLDRFSLKCIVLLSVAAPGCFVVGGAKGGLTVQRGC